jgi:hypothetical protein
MYPFSKMASTIKIDKISQAPTNNTSFLFTLNLPTKNGSKPKTSVIWDKIDPKESPTFMSPWPIWDARIEFTTSGKSVPIETSTNPIINGEAPRAVAMSTECSTAVSLEKTSSIMPAIKINNGTEKVITYPIKMIHKSGCCCSKTVVFC